MIEGLETIIRAVRALSSRDQLEVLQVITQDLRQNYLLDEANYSFWSSPTLDDLIHNQQTQEQDSLAITIADFWPIDEDADDINAYIARCRKEN